MGPLRLIDSLPRKLFGPDGDRHVRRGRASTSFLQVWQQYLGFILACGPGRGWYRTLLIFLYRKFQARGVRLHMYLCLGF